MQPPNPPPPPPQLLATKAGPTTPPPPHTHTDAGEAKAGPPSTGLLTRALFQALFKAWGVNKPLVQDSQQVKGHYEQQQDTHVLDCKPLEKVTGSESFSSSPEF